MRATRPGWGLGSWRTRARDVGAAETAVPAGVLGEVLLVVLLGVVERPDVADLGRDLAEAGLGERALIRET